MSRYYDPTSVLAGLKDFQRQTVEYVYQRMYEDTDPATRFLVADEVGLGKTMVARGVIAKVVRKLQEEGVERIDVIYVCSNADIAAQNVRRLTLPGFSSFTRATRLTMLPLELHDLSRNKLNFVAFTPGTSFNLRSSMGMVKERAVLHVLLRKLWGSNLVTTSGGYRILQGWVKELSSFKWWIDWVRKQRLDRELVGRFAEAVAQADREAHSRGEPGFQDRFAELAERFRYKKSHRPDEDLYARMGLVGELRQVLARTCIDALQPDLVILDEFQRFRSLLDGSDPASELAQTLFDYSDVRTLLLSATPYKMYSLHDEAEDDHYRDFIRTARFLMGERVEGFADDLDEFRRALFDIASPEGRQKALAAKQRVERQLRRVMVRTERLAATADRSGMLAEIPPPEVRLEPQDLSSFLAAQRVAELVDAGNVTEYWKSAPYLLNFMDGYQLVRRLERLDRRSAEWRQIRPLLESGKGLVSWEDFVRYERLDPQNARLRSLLASTVDRGAWKLLWIPPSMPYYGAAAPFSDPELASFTKRLVFSAWTVVPKVVASLASYEAERKMVTSGPRRYENTRESRERIKPLLQFKKSRGKISGLSALPLLYPSPSLAELGDPLRVAAELGSATRPVSRTRIRKEVARRVEAAIRRLDRAAGSDGPVDKRWYWAVPLLLDHQRGALKEWLGQSDIAEKWIGGDGDDSERSAFSDALHHALAVIQGESVDHEGRELKPLGPLPRDLAEVIADMALASPGVAVLRALSRAEDADPEDVDLRNDAAFVAWGFRTLFNGPETTSMIRGLYAAGAYWRKVLRYCVNGNLQAVLDEYVHVLRDWLGIVDGDPFEARHQIATELRKAVTLRTVGYSARDPDSRSDETRTYRFRSRFALRFGADNSEDEKELQRASSVRAAFNSPFWPFILVTTSVGQEGLDFHLYCHAVVHWNLPANPVDLEQREGRIHRYKGHAVRKNLAHAHRRDAIEAGGDPWWAAFEAARNSRSDDENDLVPFWLYPGRATIDRYVPNLPLSREVARLENLKRSLAVYRLVFGQPRQEDLVEYLLSRGLSDTEIQELVEELRVDLRPGRIPPAEFEEDHYVQAESDHQVETNTIEPA